MGTKMLLSGVIAVGLLLLATCGAGSQQGGTVVAVQPTQEFSSYWYQGKAEIARFDLKQARYGELRNGHAVLVFVTEDFLVKEQVKYDGDGNADRTSVLKTNLLERYSTGIYDYAQMTSVFSPVDGTPALKANTSVQDWCGQVFSQVNRRGKSYTGTLFSYFQSEGDHEFAVGDAWLEDALFNQVRLDPARLPTGAVRMLPSLRFLRLMHKPTEAVEAQATLVSDGTISTYTVQMPALQRTLSIRFTTAFPHALEGWSETRPDGRGANAQVLTTEAVRTHRVMEPYWEQNANSDDPLRDRLGLERMRPQ